ncbi:MAG TPA: hypothetical protein VKG80_07590, partial [Trebonia sp.]|nr:hypothetical protein [Trebonia sp.]
LERAAGTLTALDVANGKTVPVTNYMADPVEMKLLHMITGDPKRTASLALFANPDFWLDSSLPTSCGTKVLTCEPAGGDAWNHGDVAPEINTTWLGLVGPGVEHQGVNNSLWSDHTDIQPTMMELLRLRDDYTPDGRVLTEVIKPGALPRAMRIDTRLLVKLGDSFSQINAAVGAFGMDTLRASTVALRSDAPKDATYTKIENDLIKLGSERDAIVTLMKSELYGAAFGGHPLNVKEANGLLAAANGLLAQAAALA